MGVGIVTDGQTWGGDTERERERETSWWWIDRRKRSRRRRAAIRTKTSVTFWGFSLLPFASGPWSKPHRLYCVMVCVALCLCRPASGDWRNHDSAEIELHRIEWSTACWSRFLWPRMSCHSEHNRSDSFLSHNTSEQFSCSKLSPLAT